MSLCGCVLCCERMWPTFFPWLDWLSWHPDVTRDPLMIINPRVQTPHRQILAHDTHNTDSQHPRYCSILWVSWVWRSITTLHNEAQHPSWECWLWRMSAASDGSAVTMCSEYPALMSTMSWQLCFELNTQQSIHGGYQHWHSAYSVFTDNNLNTNILFIKSQTPSQIFSLFIHHNNSMFEQHWTTNLKIKIVKLKNKMFNFILKKQMLFLDLFCCVWAVMRTLGHLRCGLCSFTLISGSGTPSL